MRKITATLLAANFFLWCGISSAEEAVTNRIPQFKNDKVSVWETIIYLTAKQDLKPHRHDHDRVLVAFNDGTLKVTNDKGQSHFIKLQKEKAIFLTKDVPNELHTDENISGHPIRLMVIEINSYV